MRECINKRYNGYAEQISFYDQCPKAVLAALAVSFSRVLEEELVDEDSRAAVSAALAREWEILHTQGIVPQRPPRAVFEMAMPRIAADGARDAEVG